MTSAVEGLIVLAILAIVILLLFRPQFAKKIASGSKVRLNVGLKGLTLEIEDKWSHLQPTDVSPQAAIDNTDPKVIELLKRISGHPTPLEKVVTTTTELRGVPQTPTEWRNSTDLLTSPSTTTTLAVTGTTNVTGDTVTYTVRTDILPLLVEKAKEAEDGTDAKDGEAR